MIKKGFSYSQLIIFLIFTFLINTSGFSQGELRVTGNGEQIQRNSTIPKLNNNTDFGEVNLGSSRNSTFKLENLIKRKKNKLNNVTVSISGSSAFSQSISNIGNIKKNSPFNHRIKFNPTTAGTHTATVTINYKNGKYSSYSFVIQGKAAGPSKPNIEVSGKGVVILDDDATPSVSDDTDFGSVNVSSGSVTHTFTITNTGNADLLLIDPSPYITLIGDTADFTLTAIPSTPISSSGTTTFEITFDPTIMGAKTAYVYIDSNVSGQKSTYAFAISGTGLDPEMNIFGGGIEIANGDVTPSSTDNTDYGSVDVGFSSSVITYTIESDGNTNLNLTGAPIISLSNSTDFTVDYSLTSSSVSAGSSTTFTIVFNPVSVGTLTSTISIVNNDSDESLYTFIVQGIGIAPFTEGPGGVVSDLKLWLKANDGLSYNNGDPVSLWETQALGSNATVNTVGQEPTFRDDIIYNVNFNPVVQFSNSYTSVFKDSDFSFDDTNTQFLEGSSGYYSQDIFVVIIPDDTPINNTFGFMDMFCGDADMTTDEEDATGLGLGDYSGRVDDEIIMYAHGTYSTGTPGDGYAVAEIGTGSSYNNVGIINAYNNLTLPQQELSYNANDIGNTQNNSIDDMINVSDTKFWIGRSEGWEASLNGRIAEIITYSSRKSDASYNSDRRKIESYLAIKYGITLGVNGSSQDYVDSDGDLIWDVDTGVAAEDVFNYDIAGIGRDDDSELNQKQSKTVNNDEEDITLGLIDIYNTNNLNTNTFSSDRNFICWGNDNGTLAAQPAITVDISSGISGLNTVVDFISIGRTWKVVEHGSVATSKISLPATLLSSTITPPGDYLMFISDSPTFSPASEYRIMTLNGSDLETNYDFPSNETKYITFGYAPERTFVRSIQFDGTKDYLDAGDVLNLNNTAFTVSAWIKRNNVNSSIFSKRDAGYTTGYDFGINGSGNVFLSWNGGSESITSSISIPTTEWHQVAVIYDGADATLYIDGVKDTTATLSQPVTNSESFIIAAADGDEANTTSFFQGNIDEVRIWNIALTEGELRFIMNQEIEENSGVKGSYFNTILAVSPTKNISIPWANLQAYYPMSTYTFTNCKDNSGKGNTAALKNLTIVDHQTAPLPYISSIDGNWDATTTWTNGSIQTIPNAVSIVNASITVDWNIVETTTNVNTTRDVKVLGLVNSANELSINDANSLEISHYLKIDGVLDLDGESQLIQTIDSDFDVSSTGFLERDQQGEGNRFRYNDWSPPVYTGTDVNGDYTTVSASLRDGTNPSSPGGINYTSGYNGSTSPLTLSTYWMYKYVDSPEGDYSSWFQAGSTGKIYAGEGFLMKGTGNPGDPEQNYIFQGKPNNGTIQLNVAADYNYLVGNPYPSAIDAIQFITDNPGLNSGAIYFWEHYGGDTHILSGYQAGYATINLLGISTPASSNIPSGVSTSGTSKKTLQRYIAVGQGFFFWSGAANTTIEFNNSQRIFKTEASGESVFMKAAQGKSSKASESTGESSRIRIGFDAPEIDHRQLLLGADKNATDNVDWGYDAKIYEVLNDDMYFLINNDKYIIQGVNTINPETEIPIGIQSKKGGIINIKVDELIDTPNDIEVYVLDKTTSKTYDIKNDTFEVVLEPNTNVSNKYAIVFKENIVLSVEDMEHLEDNMLLYMNNTDSELIIRNNTEASIKNIKMFNYLGQTISEWSNNLDKKEVYLPVNVSSGVYFVRTETSKGILNKKIIID